jgi:membrane-associated phospholipid phosphatase
MEATIVAIAVSLGTAAAVAIAVLRWPRPTRQLVPTSGEGIAPARIAPDAPSGAMLTVAIVAIVVIACAVGVVAFLLRRDPATFGVDQQVETWADGVATPLSDDVLRGVTHLGDTLTVLMVGSVLAGWYAWRRRSATAFAFLTAVIVGQFAAAELVKAIVDRARPALSQRADFSGTSFPSGHSTAATACYLAFALVLAAGRPVRTRAVLIGGAAGVGVAVASSRVLLGVHWLSDAVAGVALGASVALLAHASFARRPRWWRAANTPIAERAATTGLVPDRV